MNPPKHGVWDGGTHGNGKYLQRATWSIGGRQQTNSLIERDSLRATGVEGALQRPACCPSEKSVALCSKERQEHNKPTEPTTYSSFHYSGVKRRQKPRKRGFFVGIFVPPHDCYCPDRRYRIKSGMTNRGRSAIRERGAMGTGPVILSSRPRQYVFPSAAEEPEARLQESGWAYG